MPTTEQKICLTIMVDMKAKKVVFAEENWEFVDFLISLLSLPLATITNVLLQNDKGMVGGIGALYKSIDSLDVGCVCTFDGCGNTRETLEPSLTSGYPLLSIANDLDAKEYVNGGTVYTVMDNMEIKPMSLVHLKSNVMEIDLLEVRHVEVGVQEGLAILKASLQTTDVLTSVFL